MRIRVNRAIQTTKGQSGSQKVSQVESVAVSGKRGTGAQSNSTEAASAVSKQECHGLAFPKSRNQKRANRRRKNRRGTVNDTKIHKHDTIAPAVGLKCTDSKYATIAPAVGLKYSKVSEEQFGNAGESVKVIVRSNNLGELKARIVIQLGDGSLGQFASTEKPTVASDTTSEPILLTKSAGSNKKKWKQATGRNSQGPQKSNFRNQNKPFGRNTNKNKGYRSPNSEKGNSIPVRSYTPFTETQKRNFSRLLKETLLSDC
jgi:hypothetical protein